MAASPQYASSPIIGQAFCTVANPNRDGTGTLVALNFLTAGTNGRRIDRLIVQAIANTTQGMVRVFLTAPASTARLIMEIQVDAVTPSATVPAFHREVALFGGMTLPNGWSMSVGIQNAQATIVTAIGADF